MPTPGEKRIHDENASCQRIHPCGIDLFVGVRTSTSYLIANHHEVVTTP